MTLYHSHENILKAFNYNGAKIELVDWQETIWCGKIGYAVNNTEEPDVDEGYPVQRACQSQQRRNRRSDTSP